MKHMTEQRYAELIARFAKAHVVVAGDLIADEFLYGQVERVSREAPVLILKYDTTEILPGGAGNAANNVAALGAKVNVVGVVGRDETGGRLLGAMPTRANTRGIVRAAGYVTPVKTRVLAGGVHSAKQQVVRIDRVGPALTSRQHSALVRRLEDALALALGDADVVIVSDYGSGLYTPDLIARAEAKAAGEDAAVFSDQAPGTVGRPHVCGARADDSGGLAVWTVGLPRCHGVYTQRVGGGGVAWCHDRRRPGVA